MPRRFGEGPPEMGGPEEHERREVEPEEHERREYREEEPERLYSTEDPEWKRREELLRAMDVIDLLLMLRAAAPERGRFRREGYREEFEFFPFSDEREQLVKYCSSIAEYLRRENVADLIIADRSARPLYVGVREYWNAKYPGEKAPGIKFMNPKGFKSEDLPLQELRNVAEDAYFKDDAYESSMHVRSEQEIIDELKDVYAELLKDKDKPVLIFDTCIHTGKSLEPMLDTLKKAGFSDLRVGAVTPADSASRVKTDFHIAEGTPAKGCYPFDKDRIIEKTFDHVYSKRTEDPRKRERSIRLRKEIKQIMKEFLESEKSPRT